jgi:hypothetical protein
MKRCEVDIAYYSPYEKEKAPNNYYTVFLPYPTEAYKNRAHPFILFNRLTNPNRTTKIIKYSLTSIPDLTHQFLDTPR